MAMAAETTAERGTPAAAIRVEVAMAAEGMAAEAAVDTSGEAFRGRPFLGVWGRHRGRHVERDTTGEATAESLMTTIETSTFIRRSVADVFAFVGDQHNAVRWQKGLVEVRRATDGPIGVGTRHSFVRTIMGRKMEAQNECSERDGRASYCSGRSPANQPGRAASASR
jgi:hypothetical protein